MMPVPIVDVLPDAAKITQIFESATSPTFFLGAVAAFTALMSSRMSSAIQEAKELNAIAKDHPDHVQIEKDFRRQLRRAQLLRSGILAALNAGVCATVLLAILFVTNFVSFRYAVGAGAMFFVATVFLCVALIRFAQEAKISVITQDEIEIIVR